MPSLKPLPTSSAGTSESLDGTLDRLARGSALSAILLLAAALLALGFSSHRPDEALSGTVPPLDIDDVNAPAHVAPILEIP